MSLDIFAPYFSGQEMNENSANTEENTPSDREDIFAPYFKMMNGQAGTNGEAVFSFQTTDHPPLNQNVSVYGNEKNGAPGSQPYDLAILGGSLVLPEFGVIPCDIYSRDGRVVSLNQGGPLPSRQVLNAKGKMVLPGIIDPHVHMGIVDSLSNELQSETLSGLLGGVTTAGLFVGADLASLENFSSISDQVKKYSRINILPHFVIASREQIASLPQVVKSLGIRSFKIYLHGVTGLIESKDDTFVVDTMTALKATGERCVLCVHTENHSLVLSATERTRSLKGDNATLLDWAETHPEIAEEEAVIRIAFFAQKLKQLTYIVHVSTAGAVEKLREIRKTNPYILCETVSPYLMLNPERAKDFAAKMEPPIRGGSHAEALWEGLREGVIDTIGTDNVSWNLSQKNLGKPVWEALPGYPAMATHLPSVLSGGFSNRGFELSALVSKMTAAPAKAFGIYPKKGTLLPGSDADMVIVDLHNLRKVDPKKLRSRAEYSIYEDQYFTGWPSATILGGQVAAADGEPVGRPGGSLII